MTSSRRSSTKKSRAKFKIGDSVIAYHLKLDITIKGLIISVSRQEDTYEYKITNSPLLFAGFPLLWWESEIKPNGCYCDEDQGAGYTYDDEHGFCDVCLALEKD